MNQLSFPIEDLVLQRIYTGASYDACTEISFPSHKTESIYGPLRFPPVPTHRPYTFGSFVISLDGRISYPSSPDGNLVANTNKVDPKGGLCDYWILNLLRANSDAVVMGSVTIKREPRLTGNIYDHDLLQERVDAGFVPIPLLVIISSTGANIPLDHLLYTNQQIPTLTAVSPYGANALKEMRPKQFEVLPTVSTEDDLIHIPSDLTRRSGNYLVGVGKDTFLDPTLVLRVLHRGGVKRSLIETPTFLATLMREHLLDELFLNTSMIVIGGKSLTIGEHAPAFTVESHPHARVLTIHAHSDSFLYTRYKLDYSFM